MGAEEDVVHWGTREDLQIRWKDCVGSAKLSVSACPVTESSSAFFLPLFNTCAHGTGSWNQTVLS